MKVGVIGPIFLDLIYASLQRLPQLGEEVYSENFYPVLGGSAITQAMLLDRFGVNITFGTFLSNGFRSQMVIKLLEEHQFDNYVNLFDAVQFKEIDPTPITSVMSCENDRSFLSYQQGEVKSFITDEALYQFLKGSDWCLAIPDRLNVMKRLYLEGTRFIYDIGWNDNLSIEKEAEILSLCEIFTPNEKEALALTRTTNITEAIKVLACYVKNPIITLGESGVLYYDREIIECSLPIKFNAVDTTGAGDNFLAGVIYGLTQSWDLRRSIKMGLITGGYSTTSVGCCEAKLSLSKAMSYLKKCEEGGYNN